MRVWIEMPSCISWLCLISVTLRVRVWIEIPYPSYCHWRSIVTLRVRVWIEITTVVKAVEGMKWSPSV